MKSTRILVLLVFLLQACASTESAGPQRTDNIAKSPNDRRDYRALVLENGLKVLLVSDPETDKAAAAMDVDAGSNSDPADFAGLAHFLEHMLFLGTEKYPASGEYHEYISSHGGSHNAYTAYENTNYYFDIEQQSLAPALDRFAQFFIAPLFNEEYVNRERNAVHSEYQSNLQNDGRRSYSIFKKVINPDHPLAQFSVGSLGTLQDKPGMPLRQALLDHYARYYSANLMSLSIYGRESLDDLEGLARTYFSGIDNRNVSAPRTDEPLFLAGQLPAMLEIEPVRDVRSLSYTFPIPVVRQYWREKPLNYLGNILGHEGEGSLLSLLRSRGWANGLSAGGGMSYADNASFSVSIALTEEGVNRIDDITRLVFEFIRLAREEGIHKWLFDEQRTMAEIAFAFQEPGSPVGTVGGMSRRLQEYPPAEIITAAFAFEHYDPALYLDILSYLHPDNVLLTFTSQSVDGDTVDPLFGGEYRYAPLSPGRVAAWQPDSIDPALTITEPNPFLPDDLSIKDVPGVSSSDGPEEKPELIIDGDGIRYWFKHDNRFQVPRANFYAYALTPLFSESLEYNLLSSLAINLVNDKLNEFSYPANLAGVFYGVSSRARGFTLRTGGYNDKQPILLEELLKTLVAADFEEERFNIIRTEMIRGWENADRQMPYVRLYQEMQALLVNPWWSEQQRIEAIRYMTLADVKAFIPRMLQDLNLQVFYHGNVTEADAMTMLDILTRYLDITSDQVDPPYGTVVKMEVGQHVIQEIEVDHDDSAIVIYEQGPDDSLGTRAIIALLGNILRTPFFDSLRTEQQLGYVVSAGTMPILKTSGLTMTIESPGADPVLLETRINAFLRDYAPQLEAMPESMFDDIKAGLLNNLRQEPQSLQALSGRYWGDIMLEEYDRDSTLAMADAIEALDKAAITGYYRRHVMPPGSGRLVARSFGHPHQAARAALSNASDAGFITVEDTLESYNAFKADADFYEYKQTLQVNDD
jgi:insulysin